MNLSPHFTYEELIASVRGNELGINNNPPPDIAETLKRTAQQMERVRELLGGKSIIVSSGYRCPRLNAAVGGSKTSAHCLGYAVDFTCPEFGSVFDTATFLAKSDIKYDQLIYEFRNWVHISFDTRMRQEALSIFNAGQYLPGIVRG